MIWGYPYDSGNPHKRIQKTTRHISEITKSSQHHWPPPRVPVVRRSPPIALRSTVVMSFRYLASCGAAEVGGKVNMGMIHHCHLLFDNSWSYRIMTRGMIYTIIYAGWWFVAIFYVPIYWVSNHPNWRTHIFQRGGPTTNQRNMTRGMIYTMILIQLILLMINGDDLTRKKKKLFLTFNTPFRNHSLVGMKRGEMGLMVTHDSTLVMAIVTWSLGHA